MEAFVLDASITLAWCFDDEADAYSDELLNWCAAATEVHVASVWPLEIANILLHACKKGRVTSERVEQFVHTLMRLPIHVAPANTEDALLEVLPLAQQHSLTAYDAAYLALARRQNLPLATNDSDLRKAATAAGVRLLDPFAPKESIPG
jgi:predicted nucleic acid-binding protein